MIAVSSLLSLYFLAHGIIEPRTDEIFVKKLQDFAQTHAENSILLSTIEPSDWNIVCNYSSGGPSDVTQDLQEMFTLPKKGKLHIIEGNNIITDDEAAVVFFDETKLEARVKYVTGITIKTDSKNGCLKGRNNIFIKSYPSRSGEKNIQIFTR